MGDLNKRVTQSVFSAVVFAMFTLGVALLVASQENLLGRYKFEIAFLLSCVAAVYLITIHIVPTLLQGKYKMGEVTEALESYMRDKLISNSCKAKHRLIFGNTV